MIETQYFTIGVTKEEDEKYIIRRITTNHVVNNNAVSFELKEESDGTQRLFDFAPVLYDLMQSDKTIIIDEIDRSIHANLLKMFVEKVMALPILGQIIFSSHESCLLDCSILGMMKFGLLRKTEIIKVLVSIRLMILSHEMI